MALPIHPTHHASSALSRCLMHIWPQSAMQDAYISNSMYSKMPMLHKVPLLKGHSWQANIRTDQQVNDDQTPQDAGFEAESNTFGTAAAESSADRRRRSRKRGPRNPDSLPGSSSQKFESHILRHNHRPLIRHPCLAKCLAGRQKMLPPNQLMSTWRGSRTMV